jgi:hypothetical protein
MSRQQTTFDVDVPTLWDAEVLEPENPLPESLRPVLAGPLSRSVREAIEAAIEANAADGISWGWTFVEPNECYRTRTARIILSDCRVRGAGMTLGVLLSDSLERDPANVVAFLNGLNHAPAAVPARKRRARAA